MNRIFIPTLGPTDWRRLLADPQKQWRQKKSAWEAAVAWEAARRTTRGLPDAIATLLDSEPTFFGASLVLGLPEHQVALEGGGHASQADLWVLVSTDTGLVSMSIEAKAGESFDRLVSDWSKDASPNSGKPTRLSQLRAILELTEDDVQHCRYQLLHRSVSAILEAQRFKLSTALFLVQAFGDNSSSFEDYVAWAKMLGVTAEPNRVHHVGQRGDVSFWIAWSDNAFASDDDTRSAI
jgi:hypothetical protein